jgi:hypothetical protein
VIARPHVCRCGHDADTHEHWRPGSDCGACGAADCPRYRPEPVAPAAVDDDDQLLDTIAVDVDRACTLAGPRLVGRIVAVCAAEVTR